MGNGTVLQLKQNFLCSPQMNTEGLGIDELFTLPGPAFLNAMHKSSAHNLPLLRGETLARRSQPASLRCRKL